MRNDRPGRAEVIANWAPVAIRLALGAVFIAHGSQKLFGAFGGSGVAGVAGMTESMGLRPPMMWAWLLALTEFFGGLGVLVGLFTRPAALGIAVVMVVAAARVHFRNGFFLPGGFEFNLALLAMAVSLIISGAGAISLDWPFRRWWESRRGRRPR